VSQDVIRLGLVGNGIQKSMAPSFHRLAGQLCGRTVTYDLFDLPVSAAGLLPDLFRYCETERYSGLNVTFPFKEVAATLATVGDASVRAIGAVNTVRFGEHMAGFNTDFSGLVTRWRTGFAEVAPGVVAQIGAGGVGKATAYALGELGATELRLTDVDLDRARGLASAVQARFGGLSVQVVDSARSAVDGADGIVNATPVGMYFSPGSPVPLDLVGPQRWVFDAVYSPLHTAFTKAATTAGLTVINGFQLFLGQAFDAFEIFTGLQPTVENTDVIERAMWAEVSARQ
jgi:shikimate dehydrogenase